MAFGSSGAGKTHTMLGTEAEPGILPRSIRQVFKDLQGLPHKVLVSYYEVYNDLVNDLLDGSSCSHHSRAGSSGPSQPSGTASTSTSQPTASLAGGASGEPAPQQQRQDRWQAGKAPLRHALLQPREPARPVLRIREDPQGRVVIPRLSEVVCHSAEQALELQHRAAKLRQQAATGVNSTSSRSHCVFT
ncbi:kinesin motor domain-containing protein, partial [Haematococcus lacustris]